MDNTLNLEQLEKDKQELILQRDEYIAQTHMVNGAIQFISQKIEQLKQLEKLYENSSESNVVNNTNIVNKKNLDNSINSNTIIKSPITEQNLKQLYETIKKEQKRVLGKTVIPEIREKIEQLATNKNEAISLMIGYREVNGTDLYEELKGLSSSYDAIKENLLTFINLGIVEEQFPHEIKKGLNII